MCGIAGVARHPEGRPVAELQSVLTRLLQANEARGHHATGVAAPLDPGRPILKLALEASKFVRIPAYEEFLTTAAVENSTVLLGHTRHATHANAHEDRAAHPFRDGPIVGVHNGVIYNWQEVEAALRKERPNEAREKWCNDSQAAFAVLANQKNPAKALDVLDGWWALTWAKGRSLFMCRTDNVPLHCAYVGVWRALVWSSEERPLRAALEAEGLTLADYDLWQLKPGTIYRYDTAAFTEGSAHADKQSAPFNGIRTAKGTRFNSARPDMLPGKKTPRTGMSTQRTLAPGGPGWDPIRAEERTTRADGLPDRPRVYSIGDIEKNFQALHDKINALQSKVDVQAVELDHLYKLLNEQRPEVFEECGVCHQGGGELVALPDGGAVHVHCIFTGKGA